MRERACSIVIRGGKFLFVEQIVDGALRHVFIGGGVEDGETARQAALRELLEEANVCGSIVFGPAMLTSGAPEYIFVVEIPEDSEPVLGFDPELPSGAQEIKRLLWRDADAENGAFNAFDLRYFSAVVSAAKNENVEAEWLDTLKKVLGGR